MTTYREIEALSLSIEDRLEGLRVAQIDIAALNRLSLCDVSTPAGNELYRIGIEHIQQNLGVHIAHEGPPIFPPSLIERISAAIMKTIEWVIKKMKELVTKIRQWWYNNHTKNKSFEKAISVFSDSKLSDFAQYESTNILSQEVTNAFIYETNVGYAIGGNTIKTHIQNRKILFHLVYFRLRVLMDSISKIFGDDNTFHGDTTRPIEEMDKMWVAFIDSVSVYNRDQTHDSNRNTQKDLVLLPYTTVRLSYDGTIEILNNDHNSNGPKPFMTLKKQQMSDIIKHCGDMREDYDDLARLIESIPPLLSRWQSVIRTVINDHENPNPHLQEIFNKYQQIWLSITALLNALVNCGHVTMTGAYKAIELSLETQGIKI